MEVLEVTLEGMDHLIEFRESSSLPMKMNRVMNHVGVQILLRASLPQLLVAKQMSTKFAMKRLTMMKGETAVTNYPYPEVELICTDLVDLIPWYNENPDLLNRVSSMGRNFTDNDPESETGIKSLMETVPIGAVVGTAYFYISGYDLIDLCDGNISKILEDCIIKDDNLSDDDLQIIEINLVKMFVSKLNRNWMYQIVENTQVTDTWLKKNQYILILTDKDCAGLKRIYLEGTGRSASFVNAGEDLPKQLEDIGSGYFAYKGQHVYAEIICYTPIFVYYLIMLGLPNGTIIDCEDYINLITQPREFCKILSDEVYDENNWDVYYTQQVQPTPDDEMSVLMKHSLIPGNTKISYTIRAEITNLLVVDEISMGLSQLEEYDKSGACGTIRDLIRHAHEAFVHFAFM
jgi:hypothetical protein